MRALLILLALARLAWAEPTSSSPLDDSARILDTGDQAALAGELRQLSAEGVDLAVILTRRLDGVPIETFARDAAIQWTSGKAESASAAVLVIALDDRKSRIEVNDTFRPKFPDARAQVTLDNIRGFLRGSDYAGAVRAVITDVRRAGRGEPPDLESPNPQADLPATSSPSSTPAATYDRPGTTSDNTITYLVIGGIAFFLGMGALWAWTARKGNFTLTHDGAVKTLERPFVVDWLWHSAKLVGWVGFIIFIIASASSSSSSNTSSSWGSSSSGGSSSGSGFSGFSGGGGSSSGGGGWSGGGASSSW